MRSNHKDAKTKDSDEIFPKKQQEINELTNIDLLLEEEIDKYNRLKTQKQKEAKFFYEEEAKKMKLLENLKMRDEKIIQIKEKNNQEKVEDLFIMSKSKNF